MNTATCDSYDGLYIRYIISWQNTNLFLSMRSHSRFTSGRFLEELNLAPDNKEVENYMTRQSDKPYYYTSDSLWKIWLVESIQSIHNSLWTWHDKCNICCRYYISHFKFKVCLVTKPLGVFSSEKEWLNVAINVYKDFLLRIFVF